MRRLWILVVLLAALLLSGRAEAQSCNGCGIGYWTTAGGTSTALTTAGFGYASNVGWLVNGTSPQSFHLYETYTDGSNYTRLRLNSVGNQFYLIAEYAGGGSQRRLNISSGGSGMVLTSGRFEVTGNFAPATTDATTNLGDPSYLWPHLYMSRSIQGSKSKALSGGSATTFLRVAVPQTAAANYGGGEVGYTVYATDGTDSQSLVGKVYFAMVNKAGTETCAIGEVGTPVLGQSSGSTLTCTFTCATAAADTVDIAANCASGLVETTFTIEHRGDMQKTNTYSPQ